MPARSQGRPPRGAGRPPRRTLVRAARSALAVVAAAFASAPSAAGQRAPDPIDAVDPFLGTGGHGHVYPGATVPHGMVQLSPDNGRGGWDWVAGYHASDSVVVGFAHTHLSGTGIGDLADVLFMPGSGSPGIAGPWAEREARPFADRYTHRTEAAEPGYYRVRLDRSGILVELTATTRTGVHRYTFPDSGPAALLVDLGYAVNWDRPVEGELRLVNDTLLVGSRASTGWAADQRVHFAATFSRPVLRATLVVGDSAGLPARPVEPGGRSGATSAATARGRVVRTLLEFGVLRDPLVIRVGISHVDQDGALRNLAAEAGPFDELRRAARSAWTEELDRVRVVGGTPSRRTLFYTSLYRVHLGPVRVDDVDGRTPWTPRSGGEPPGARYSIFSLWDTFRAEHPLLTLVSPERQPGILHSLLGLREHLGLLPVWELLGNETNTMTGYHAVPVLADLILKGWGAGSEQRALEAMVETADQEGRDVGLYRRHGFVPADSAVESVTKTLEYAYDDAAIARVADALGRDGIAARFAQRSRAWTRVFDPGTGFMRGRLADGAWRVPFDPFHSSHREDTDYTEGTAWQHSWFVPHDPDGLIARLGGDAPFVARLDALFTQDTTLTGENVSADITGMLGQYAQGNEPGHHTPWLYVYAGAPWKTHARVREILDTLYRDARDGLPGNEDYGQMSAWYVFGAMGLYPVDPVGGVYVLGSPLFDEVGIDVGGGRVFRVIAPGASERPYVVGARLDGEPWPYTWITHDRITAGGVLELEMAHRPDPWYGRSREHRPPSLGPARTDRLLP